MPRREVLSRSERSCLGWPTSGRAIPHRSWLLRMAIVLLFGSGCAHFPVNPPAAEIDASSGYRFQNLELGAANTEETFVIVSLSGGGTRAAALDYGVLSYLSSVSLGGRKRSLLDEVDVITSSSSASLAAAYYGIFGREAFLEDFPTQVLYQKLERAMKHRLASPWHWPRLWSPRFGRSDLAAELIGRRIFDDKTYADMPRVRPFIMINATDVSLGASLSFTQGHFDRLCSDLDGVAVGRAVTAAMAFSGAFTPVTLKNYPKADCGYTTPEWVVRAIEDEIEPSARRYDNARNWLSYEDAVRRPWIHLLDSGIADNIGLRAPKAAFLTRDEPWSIVDRIENGSIQRLVILVVDARRGEEFAFDRRARPPRLFASVSASASRPLANYSSETVEVVRQAFSRAEQSKLDFDQKRGSCEELTRISCTAMPGDADCSERELQRCFSVFGLSDAAKPPQTDLYLIHLRFEVIDDGDLRRRLETIPTTLQLPRESIDLLIESAPKMIAESHEFQRLMMDLSSSGFDG